MNLRCKAPRSVTTNSWLARPIDRATLHDKAIRPRWQTTDPAKIQAIRRTVAACSAAVGGVIRRARATNRSRMTPWKTGIGSIKLDWTSSPSKHQPTVA